MSRILAVLFGVLFGFSQFQIHSQQAAIEGLQGQIKALSSQIDSVEKAQHKAAREDREQKKDLRFEGEMPIEWSQA
jgi:Tfp pilus assembly protein PilN